MKSVFTFLLLFLGIGGFQKISEINEHTRLAESSFRKGQFAEAVRHYELVVYARNQQKPELLLNLAHAYLKNNEPEKAQKIYTKCTKTRNQFIRSVAWENLGTIQTKLPDYQQALTFYKRALVANPENEQARYNYELLKKFLREHPEEQKQIPPPAPEKKEKQEEKQEEKKPQPDQKEKSPQSAEPDTNGNQENDSKEKQEKGQQEQKPEKQTDPEGKNPPKQEKPNGQNGQEKEQKQGEEKGKEEGENLAGNENKPSPDKPNKKPGKEQASGEEQRLQTQYERLRKANISPEKANMMLEAMRASEQQYLQQLPKKPSKKTDNSKPNW